MATASSISNSSPADEYLVGCGIDAESPDRFRRLAREKHPWPLVFSPNEANHLLALPEPHRALCAAFCCKEALLKACRRSFSFPLCQFLPQSLPPSLSAPPAAHTLPALTLDPTLRAHLHIGRAIPCIVRDEDHPDEIVVVVLAMAPVCPPNSAR